MATSSSGVQPAVLYNAPVGPRNIFSALVVVGLGLVFSAKGQEEPKLSHQLIAIHVRGLNRFQPDQVTRGAGLRLGQLVDEAALKQASDRLGETGLFTRVHYTYRYSSAGCELEMEVEENDKLLPVTFENLVWFSDPELVELAGARLPLFRGLLPLAGKLSDQLAEALKATLASRGIAGEIDYLPVEDSTGSIASIAFRLSGHPILTHAIDFVGASAAESADLAAAARPLLGQPYLRTTIAVASRSSFSDVYQERGYLKAKFSAPQTKIVEDGAQTQVDVSIPVSPGREYRFSGVRITDNRVFASEELERRIRLKVGEPANAVELKENVGEMERLYGTKGYIAARIDPSPELDEAAATVGYVLKVSEGDLYRMGELRIEGLGDYAAELISRQWQMKSGEPFDQTYIDRFFKVSYRDIGLGSSWKVLPEQSISEKDKTVSVTLRFMPKA